ncbi:MAG: CHASE3 domain-containing protein [Planctomycetota bacterium]|jgi:CHASE3 domain sensor protein
MKSRKPRKILGLGPRRLFGSSCGDALTTNQWKTFERYGYLGVALGLLILVVISSTSYQSIVRIQNDFKWFTHTREVLLNLSYFLSDLKDAEMGQRGYLLTGQESYLEPYQYVKKGVKYHFTNLRNIATDNVMQQKKLDVLEILVTERLSKLEELVALQKDKGVEAANQAMITGLGKKIMNDIQALILEMDKSEKEVLKQRAKLIAARVKYDIVVKSIGIILILITAMLVISGARRWMAERIQAEKKQMDKVKIKSDFVSTVSHELRTPLRAIKESIAIILYESAGPINNEQKKFLTVTKRNVDRLAKFINNVVDTHGQARGT